MKSLVGKFGAEPVLHVFEQSMLQPVCLNFQLPEISIFCVSFVAGHSSSDISMQGPINCSIFLFGFLTGVSGYLVGILDYLMGVLGYLMAWRRR